MSFLGMFAKCENQLLASSCLSGHLSVWSNLAPTGWIFMKFDFRGFLKNLGTFLGSVFKYEISG